MSMLTVSGGALVVHGGQIGTEQACCCGGDDNPCQCPAECERSISVTVSIGGMETTAVVQLPGAVTSRFDLNDGSGDYVEANVAIVCGAFGPDGECGWSVTIGVCYQYRLVVGGETFTIINGETFTGFLPFDEEWTAYPCPDVGGFPVSCFPFGCQATAEASIV